MADIIAVQFGAVEHASTDCRTMATSLQATLADLKAYLDKLVWTGAARVAYDADQQQWNQEFQATEAANAGRFSR